MNIFILDKDPREAAVMQCDAHVVKMILESAQMLSTAARILSEESKLNIELDLYKKAHVNHPCTIWARQSKENFDWLYKHAVKLCNEYNYRYGKRHKSQNVIHRAALLVKLIIADDVFPQTGLTPFAQAMPDEYKNEDAVTAYRLYYKEEKTKLSKFKYEKGRERPEWLQA